MNTLYCYFKLSRIFVTVTLLVGSLLHNNSLQTVILVFVVSMYHWLYCKMALCQSAVGSSNCNSMWIHVSLYSSSLRIYFQNHDAVQILISWNLKLWHLFENFENNLLYNNSLNNMFLFLNNSSQRSLRGFLFSHRRRVGHWLLNTLSALPFVFILANVPALSCRKV